MNSFLFDSAKDGKSEIDSLFFIWKLFMIAFTFFTLNVLVIGLFS
jgi:hypothetical protein